MATPTTTVELIDQVVALGLCDADRITGTFPTDQPLPDSPAEVIRQLVTDGVCTKYQGKMLLAGKGRRLVLGKYRLLRPLGRGGGGSVFLGEHTDLRRRVAVKVLRGGSSADELAVRRFKREARAAAALDHPNLVRLFDFGVSHGVPYLVMEHAPGKTLQQVLDRGGPLDVPAAVYVVTQTALGLEHAHTRGIVHRDVKPLNLMVSADGRVKLLDMGLARALDRGEDRLTEQADEGTIAGTIDYMSPEQCNGLAADPRADIYSLGATLFTLLAGRPVFQGTPAEKLAQHQTATPPALDQQVPTVPPQLARVVEKMLAKRPIERFTTCEEVVAALAPWCPAVRPPLGVIDPNATVNIRTGRKSSANWSAESSRHTVRRRWWATWTIAAVFFALLAFAVVWVALPPVVATDTGDRGPWAGDCVWLKGNEAPVNDLAFTPDGRHLVGVDWNGQLQVWDAATGRHLRSTLLKADTSGLCCAIGASGRAYAGGVEMGVYLIDPESGQVEQVIDTSHTRVWSVRPTADERRLLLAGEHGVEVWDVKTATRLTSYPVGDEYIWVAAFSPDESVVASGGKVGEDFEGAGVIHLWDAATATERLTLTGHTKPVRSIAFSPDGRTLYSGSFDGSVRVWDTTTGECLRVIDAHAGYVERVVVVSGGLLLTVGAPPKVGSSLQRMVKLWTADGQEVTGGPPEDDRHLYAAAVSSNRTRFATAAHSNTVRLWSFRPPAD